MRGEKGKNRSYLSCKPSDKLRCFCLSLDSLSTRRRTSALIMNTLGSTVCRSTSAIMRGWSEFKDLDSWIQEGEKGVHSFYNWQNCDGIACYCFRSTFLFVLIIFFSVAEDEVCGSKIGDENPKNCCPPGAIELLIARFLKWLIYSKILARLAFDTLF